MTPIQMFLDEVPRDEFGTDIRIQKAMSELLLFRELGSKLPSLKEYDESAMWQRNQELWT